nr:MAG TPA: hypothetical protein [Caudoviricetes sp.]
MTISPHKIFSSLHITPIVMTSECLILQGFREFNSVIITPFFMQLFPSILHPLSQTLKALKNLRKSRILRELLSNNRA